LAALAILVVALDVLIVRPIRDEPAFGVFFGFQVTNFDLFLGLFSLCHFICPFLFWGCPDDDGRHLLATTGKN
jgi:hypothetical protein